MQATQKQLLNTKKFPWPGHESWWNLRLYLRIPLMWATAVRMMPLSHAVCRAKTDGPGGPAKHRHRPPSSPQRGYWWIQHCTGLILATDKDTCTARTFGINRRYRETSVHLYMAWRNERRKACMLWMFSVICFSALKNVSLGINGFPCFIWF